MRRLLVTIALLLGAAAGCSRTAAPVIDALEMPKAAAPGADGLFTLDGVIAVQAAAEAHLGKAARATIRVTLPSLNQRSEFPFDLPAMSAGSSVALPLQIQLSSRAPRGPLTYRVSIVDASGLESEPVERTTELR
jgi:hypothetical protein